MRLIENDEIVNPPIATKLVEGQDVSLVGGVAQRDTPKTQHLASVGPLRYLCAVLESGRR